MPGLVFQRNLCAEDLHTNKISILKIEAVQFVASLLGVHYVFIDNECGTLCVVGNSLADLA